jgi:diphthine synthase
MVLYLIGLGLGDVEDVTVKGLNAIRKCSKVYLEAYTSILSYGSETVKLEEFYGKDIETADREFVEQDGAGL